MYSDALLQGNQSLNQWVASYQQECHQEIKAGKGDSQCDKIFRLLSDNAPHSVNEILGLGISQYNARISDLQQGNNTVRGVGVICDIISFKSESGDYMKVMRTWVEKFGK